MKHFYKRLYVTLNRYDFLFPIFFSLPLVAKLASLNLISVGVDTRTHVYKSYILIEQIRYLPPLLWGSWDWYWFAGYPFLKLYSPMFYYILAFFSVLFSCSPEIVTRWLIIVSFPLSAMSMYFLAKHLTKNKVASMIGATAYAYVPFHIRNFTVQGNPSSLLTFVFMPFPILFAERFIETSKRHLMILSSLSMVSVLLTNHGYGAFYMVVFLAWFILRKKFFHGLVVVFATILLSVFFLAPLVSYSSSNGNMFVPMRFEEDFISSVIEVIKPGSEVVGFAYIVASAMLIVLKFLDYAKTHPNHKRLHMSSLFKRNNLVFACSILIVIICFYNILIFFFPIEPFSSLVSGRTLPPTLLLSSLLLSLILATFKRRKIFIGAIFVLLILEGLMAPIYYPLQPHKYKKAFTFLKEDVEWFRVYFVPPEPEGSLIPIYAKKPTIDGWFVQGRTPALHKLLENFDEELFTDSDKALMVLKYLGVKYIIVESFDPIYGLNYSMLLYQAINSSSITEEIFSDGSIKVFRIRDYEPVVASSNVGFVSDPEEIYERIDSNKILLLRNSESHVKSESQTGEEVNLRIQSIKQEVGSFLISLTVDRSSYLMIPVSYSPNLSVKINNNLVSPLKAVPNFICVKLPQAGNYSIEISITATSIDLFADLVSLATFLFLLLWVYMQPSSRLEKELSSNNNDLAFSKTLKYLQGKVTSTW